MRKGRRAAMILTFILLVSAGLQPQIMPPQPGKLNIYSQPVNAVVFINGKQMSQHTNAAFVVAPSTYQISVKVSGSTLTCSAAPLGKSLPGAVQVSVSPGETVTITCK